MCTELRPDLSGCESHDKESGRYLADNGEPPKLVAQGSDMFRSALYRDWFSSMWGHGTKERETGGKNQPRIHTLFQMGSN